MSDPFLSSEDFADRAHQIYNEGRYDDAVALLREALDLYPFSAELHVGLAYTHMARDEFIWARRSFEYAVGLDPEHEDGLVGYGEALLRFGETTRALHCFEQVLTLGFGDDHDLMLQIGRALFREGVLEAARRFFEIAAAAHGDSSEVNACLGYTAHRLGEEDTAVRHLRRALDLDEYHAEARIYLANLVYDRGEFESALYHLERTNPEDHIDELAVWRLIELKKSIYSLPARDPELTPWAGRLVEIAASADPIDQLLGEIEATQPDGTVRDPLQLELFSALLMELAGMRRRTHGPHRVTTRSGSSYGGTWEEIVFQMLVDDANWVGVSLSGYMAHVARRSAAETGVVIPATDAEAFVHGSAAAGLLEIVR